MNAMNTPSISAALAQVATIVKIKSTSLGLKRQDKRASRESEHQHGAAAGISAVNVTRLAGAGEDRVKEIASKVGELKAEVYMRSTAYNDDRLVANTMLQEVLGVWHNGKKEYDALVDRLVADTPMLIAEAEAKLGHYNVAPPSEEEIRGAFSLSMDVSQIPDVANVRMNGVDAALEAEMRRRFEAGTAAAYQNATKDALQRIAEPLSHLVKRMTEYSKNASDTGKGGRLYDSVITNITDVGKVFRSFNVLNDPFMDKLATQLDEFNGIDADDLKRDGYLRDTTAKKAAAILDSLKDLI